MFNRAFYVFLHSLRFGFSRSNFRFRNSHCTIKHDSVKVITKDWEVSHRNIKTPDSIAMLWNFLFKASRTRWPDQAMDTLNVAMFTVIALLAASEQVSAAPKGAVTLIKVQTLYLVHCYFQYHTSRLG